MILLLLLFLFPCEKQIKQFFELKCVGPKQISMNNNNLSEYVAIFVYLESVRTILRATKTHPPHKWQGLRHYIEIFMYSCVRK